MATAAGALAIVLASGCQVLSGISSLDATGGGATTSTATSTSKSSSASGGMCSMPPGSLCGMPACPGACSGLTCDVSCGASGSSPSCAGNNITCGPSNQGDCTFHCTGMGCQNKTIQCPTNGHVCNVECADVNACSFTTIQCGDGPCNVSCGQMACVDQGPGATKVNCGNGACLVTCNQSAAPSVNQGKACAAMVTGCGMGSTGSGG